MMGRWFSDPGDYVLIHWGADSKGWVCGYMKEWHKRQGHTHPDQELDCHIERDEAYAMKWLEDRDISTKMPPGFDRSTKGQEIKIGWFNSTAGDFMVYWGSDSVGWLYGSRKKWMKRIGSKAQELDVSQLIERDEAYAMKWLEGNNVTEMPPGFKTVVASVASAGLKGADELAAAKEEAMGQDKNKMNEKWSRWFLGTSFHLIYWLDSYNGWHVRPNGEWTKRTLTMKGDIKYLTEITEAQAVEWIKKNGVTEMPPTFREDYLLTEAADSTEDSETALKGADELRAAVKKTMNQLSDIKGRTHLALLDLQSQSRRIGDKLTTAKG